MKHLYDKKRIIYHKQTSLEHILQNLLKIEYFTFDKLKDKPIVNIYICGCAYMIKLEN